MGEFFKPWRQKLGIVTLLMVCAFTASWVRSAKNLDVITFPCLKAHYWLVSGGQKFYAIHADDLQVNFLPTEGKIFSEHVKIVPWFIVHEGFAYSGLYHWRQFPVRETEVLGVFHSANDQHPIATMIPYWSIVVPLTLLTAWLLLSKPRPTAKHAATPPPVAPT